MEILFVVVVAKHNARAGLPATNAIDDPAVNAEVEAREHHIHNIEATKLFCPFSLLGMKK